ncbi:MAG: hypothetical protein FJ316_09750 [SAR202 cluster bacterium]|nr:hypothetical protein [SAR202 cluster bacterium]
MPEKYQDEIEEILRRSEEETPKEPVKLPAKTAREFPKLHRPSRGNPEVGYNPRPSRRWPRISAGKLMLAGLIIFLIAALLRWFVVVWIGLGVLVAAYLMFFIKPVSTGGYEKRWRGKPVDERLTAWQRFTRWLRS